MRIYILAIIILLCGCAHRATKANLAELAQESQSAKPLCEAYKQKLETTFKTAEVPNKREFKDRASALKVLAVLKEPNPGVPAATKEATVIIQDAGPEIFKDPKTAPALLKLQGRCALVRTYGSLSRLLEGKAKYALTESEWNDVKALTYQLVDEETSYPSTLVSVLIQLELLKPLSQEAVLKVPEAPNEIAVLVSDGKDLMEKLREADNLAFEFTETQKLRVRARSIFLKLKANP